MAIAGCRADLIRLAALAPHLEGHPRCDLRICLVQVFSHQLEPIAAGLGLRSHLVLKVSDRDLSPRQVSGLVRKKLEPVLLEQKPNIMLVFGDSTVAVASAEAAIMQETKVAHMDAGIRSHMLATPWPEEGNRREIARMASWHFAATRANRKNLLDENQLPTRIHLTGALSVDFALTLRRRILSRPELPGELAGLSRKPFVLVSLQRREGWQGGISVACEGIRKVLEERPTLKAVFIRHTHPRVREQLERSIGGHPQVMMVDPLRPEVFASLLSVCRVVVTDSGVIQEEAPIFGRKVLVVQDALDRNELMDRGYALLTGYDRRRIAESLAYALDGEALPRVSLFGDGKAASRMVRVLLDGETLRQDPPAAVPVE